MNKETAKGMFLALGPLRPTGRLGTIPADGGGLGTMDEG